MNDVFLSYASEDRERAGRLAQALEARGWSVWWDREILAGQTFDQAIEKQLESARCVLVLWSRDSITSEWVKNEAAAAAERGVLTPVKIDEVRLPLEFRRRQTISLVGWNGDDKHPAFAELCLHIGARINGTALPNINTGSAELLKRPKIWLVAVGLIVVVALALGAYSRRNSSTAQPGDTENTSQTSQPLALRKTPATLSSEMVKLLLVKNNFYDRNGNPDGKGIANRYEPQIKGNAVVLFDAATGLTWQRGGSRDQISLERAKEYVAGLNAEKHAGFADWRLPTLEEALSTMEPEARDELHFDLSFERGTYIIWTADPADGERTWVIYFYDGLTAAEPNGFSASVRAVR